MKAFLKELIILGLDPASLARAERKGNELVTRADAGGTTKKVIEFQAGSTTSDAVVVNASYNRIKIGAACAAITGGGSGVDPMLIGYGHNRANFNGPGKEFVFPYLPTDNNTANLNLFKRTAYNVQSTPAATITIDTGAGTTTINLDTALVSGERLFVEDWASIVDTVAAGATMPSYSWIGGGYDCVNTGGVMQQQTGAHHRIFGGDHGTQLGGSYGIIWDGSYGLMGGGTSLEIGPGAGVGSVNLGGYRNRTTGATSTSVGGQEKTVSGPQAFAGGGYHITVSGTASAGFGRNLSITASDALGAGNGNTITGTGGVGFGGNNTFGGNYSLGWGLQNTLNSNYGFICGYQQSVTHDYSGAMPGLGGRTRDKGNLIMFAWRDGVTGTAQRQHDFIDLALVTTTTAAALMQTLAGNTAISIPSGAVWNCTLKAQVRNHSPRPAVWVIEFSAYNISGTVNVDIIASRSFIHAGHGTAANQAKMEIIASGGTFGVQFTPRQDVTQTCECSAYLEIHEVMS